MSNLTLGMMVSNRQSLVDPGTEIDLIDGLDWCILHFFGNSEQLIGVISKAGKQVLPKADAITEIEDKERNNVLLGIWGVAYDCCTTQYEALFNLHHVRKHRIIVDYVARNVERTQ